LNRGRKARAGPGLRIDLRAAPLTPAPAPLRFAHRGARTRTPENTLAAFETALRLGVDAIEFDVRLSADGVAMVIHDETVDRTTDGEGRVGDRTLDELRRLDAGSWFAPEFRGERVPTLEETLHWARGRCGVNIEMKETGASRAARTAPAAAGRISLAEAVGRAIRRTAFRDFLVVSSFAPPALAAARAAMPEARLGWLASRSLRGLAALHDRVRLYSLHPHVRLASLRRVRLGRRLGLKVIFWTANQARLVRRLVALGCDGVMTDDPAIFRRAGLDGPAASSGAEAVRTRVPD
jgi:glycerophosphoryl diester phosphodiesterase